MAPSLKKRLKSHLCALLDIGFLQDKIVLPDESNRLLIAIMKYEVSVHFCHSCSINCWQDFCNIPWNYIQAYRASLIFSFVNNSGNFLGLTAYNTARPKTLQYTFLKRELHYVHETQKNIYHMLSHHTRRLEGLKMQASWIHLTQYRGQFCTLIFMFYTFKEN